MDFKIEKNIPLPKEAHERYLDKFWNKMDIGDSILLSEKEIKNLKTNLIIELKDESYGLYKSVKEGKNRRLWKIKEKGKKDEKNLLKSTLKTYSFRKNLGENNG